MDDLHSIVGTFEIMDGSLPELHSPGDSGLLMEYISDDLFEFSSKRKRMLLFTNDQSENSTDAIENYWQSYCPQDFCYLGQTKNVFNSSADMQTTPFMCDDDKENQHAMHPKFPYGGVDEKRKRTRVIRRIVVCPFEVVKAGGNEGEMSLEEINKRMVRAPTRPLKHPVGEFACHPNQLRHGTGYSGKAVVALTTIHTQGRGTITIIRTRD